jgi:hypothetical protein
MLTGLLPIGSVVLLKNSEKRVMIIGFCQVDSSDGGGEIWDYAGCLYPEGYIGADKTFLFNGGQIDKIYAVGYQDEEQFAFKIQADAALERLRKEKGDRRDLP